MEKPRPVGKHPKRVKLLIIFLPSCLILLLGIIIFQFSKTKNMLASSSVKGIVVNSTGMPVADAIVMIKGGQYEFNDMASVTNDQGEFFVSNIRIPGRYVLEIKHNETSITRDVNIQSPDSVIRVNW